MFAGDKKKPVGLGLGNAVCCINDQYLREAFEDFQWHDASVNVREPAFALPNPTICIVSPLATSIRPEHGRVISEMLQIFAAQSSFHFLPAGGKYLEADLLGQRCAMWPC